MIEVAGTVRDRQELPQACAAVRDSLYARAEGQEIAPEDAAALEAHLAACAECAAERSRLNRFTTDLSDLLRTLKPAVDLRKKVLAKIEVRSERHGVARAAAALGAAGVFAAVVLLAGGPRQVARLAGVVGAPRVLRLVEGALVAQAGAGGLRNGDRLCLAQGDGATLVMPSCATHLTGPGLVQIEKDPAGGMRLHVLDETRLTVDAREGAFEIRAGAISVYASGASFALEVDRTGTCAVRVARGHVEVCTPTGGATARPDAPLVIDQTGAAPKARGGPPGAP